MKPLNGEIWLEFAELTDQVGVPENTLWKGVYRNSARWVAAKDPDDRRRVLIRYGTLADATKCLVRERLTGGLEPKEYYEMQRQSRREVLEILEKSLTDRLTDACEEGYTKYLHHYRDASGTNPQRQQRCLARTAACLATLVEWRRARGANARSYEGLEETAAFMAKNDDFFPLYGLPTNPVRIKPYVQGVEVDGKTPADLVRPRGVGNQHHAGPDSAWWQATALHLRMSGRNLTGAQVVRKISDLAALTGREAPSESTVRAFVASKQFLTADKHLDTSARQLHRHRASMPLAPALYADDCWMMDGTRVQLQPHLTTDGKLAFLYVVTVRDVYSGAWLGYHFSYAESGHAYRMALKMAVSVTGRLPYELRHDHFPGSTKQEMQNLLADLKNAGVALSETSTATGKASIERAFYTLQQVFEGEHVAYWGQGIRATTANAHPTEAYRARITKQLRGEGWDFDAAWMAHCDILSTYNHTPLSRYSRQHASLHQTPWQLYELGESRGRRLDAWEVADLFWARREEGIRNRCVKLTLAGQTYRYDLTAPEHYDLLARYQREGVKLTVKYDAWDMGSIHLFDPSTGFYLAEVKRTELIQTYGPEAKWEKATAWKHSQKAIDTRRATDLKTHLAALPPEAAALMPTTLPKAVMETAQSHYLLDRAGEWQAEMAVKETQKPTRNPTKAPRPATATVTHADAYLDVLSQL